MLSSPSGIRFAAVSRRPTGGSTKAATILIVIPLSFLAFVMLLYLSISDDVQPAPTPFEPKVQGAGEDAPGDHDLNERPRNEDDAAVDELIGDALMDGDVDDLLAARPPPGSRPSVVEAWAVAVADAARKAAENSATEIAQLRMDRDAALSKLHARREDSVGHAGADSGLEQTTIIIQTYNREDTLSELIQHYGSSPRVRDIHIVWNNLQKKPNTNSLMALTETPVHVRISERNSISNRFLPIPELRTQSVLILDDDRKVPYDDLDFAVDVWKRFPEQIVGFEYRSHMFNMFGDAFYVRVKHVGSMVMTGALLFDRKYLAMYTDAPRALLEHVDSVMNCEDILFNFLYANVTAMPPILVASSIEEVESKAFAGLFKRGPTHFMNRDKCLNLFQKAFNNTVPIQEFVHILDRNPDDPSQWRIRRLIAHPSFESATEEESKEKRRRLREIRQSYKDKEKLGFDLEMAKRFVFNFQTTWERIVYTKCRVVGKGNGTAAHPQDTGRKP
eukprot:Opistho-2@87850